MHTHCRRILTFALTLTLALTLQSPASAASAFSDVPAGTPLYESVAYLSAHNITSGTGSSIFSPDLPITTRQWAVMLCRALDGPRPNKDSVFGQSCLTHAYQQGWLPLSCMLAPDAGLCRGLLYESAFAAIDLPVYDWSLYPGGTPLSVWENCLRVGAELGLCPGEAQIQQVVSRGEAALLLHAVLTRDLQTEAPPILEQLPIENPAGVALNDYLAELRRVPEPLLQRFRGEGWIYAVDFQHLAQLSETYHTSCTGAADYEAKRIYVSTAASTLHEFGHFLDWVLGFPPEHGELFAEEADAASFLRDYALTGSREYFAEYFSYFIRHRDSAAKAQQMAALTPHTYGYFLELAEHGII